MAGVGYYIGPKEIQAPKVTNIQQNLLAQDLTRRTLYTIFYCRRDEDNFKRRKGGDASWRSRGEEVP